MKLKISRTDMWTVTIEDRAGGAAEKLEPLAEAGANFEFVFARRTPEQPGKGLLVLCTVKGAKVTPASAAARVTLAPLTVQRTRSPLPGCSGVRRANTNSKLAPASASGSSFSAAPPARSSIVTVHMSVRLILSFMIYLLSTG